MTKRPQAWDYIEPVMIGPLCVGWAVNWTAYHAACDQRDRRAAFRVVNGGKDD
jgi:hypothetical protein